MLEWVLETAALARSIFVTVSFLWLGLTVVLNGDWRQPVVRRTGLDMRRDHAL